MNAAWKRLKICKPHENISTTDEPLMLPIHAMLQQRLAVMKSFVTHQPHLLVLWCHIVQHDNEFHSGVADIPGRKCKPLNARDDILEPWLLI